MKEPLNREQGLLVASGLAAISVVTWVSWADGRSGLLLSVNLLFALLFVVMGLKSTLGLPEAGARLGTVLMVLLNAAALAIYPFQLMLILTVVIAASAPYHLSPRDSGLLLALANGVFCLILYLQERFTGISGVLSLLALQAFAFSSSLARRREADAREALALRNAELEAARAELARQSQARERLRIAGALHDSLGHRLMALQLQLEVLSHQAPDSLREPLATCQQIATDLLEEVRAIVRRMPGDESRDLSDVLRRLAAATPGVSVQVGAELPTADPELTRQLAYCFQEAVHNAVRHGGADRIEISYADGCFVVDDNGVGLGPRAPQPGFGLNNLNQRLAPFGGHAVLEPGPDGGCRLRLCAPGQAA